MPRKPKDGTPRKIAKSEKDRVYWEPGEEHPLDVLYEELAELRKLIPDGLAALRTSASQTEERLRAIIEATQDADDPTALLAPTNEKARLAILSRFGNRKHASHLLAVLTIQRYKRLLGRMNAIQAALDLANGLLDEEEAFQEENVAAWRDHQDSAEEMTPQDADDSQASLSSDEEMTSTQDMEAKPEPLSPSIPEKREPPTREELRLRGIDEPLTPLLGSVDSARACNWARVVRDLLCAQISLQGGSGYLYESPYCMVGA